uniref:Hemolysin activation/secretion protein n=1 Tax=Candidatus Kentrum sp. SD TaxID=2126332 RepID=A0A451BRD4_9GAMM|nr:MAG: Hemolysin activation/secretion protein [Candidatus Kentron sp. SD]VFK49553.1 MAG: Hemolysin activation/secretion protein [Candidatus Kentron sp. SD]VFK80830.1 MAG: Hemolysin activation/secretion protein [Candidatus Kentron sp. SD]
MMRNSKLTSTVHVFSIIALSMQAPISLAQTPPDAGSLLRQQEQLERLPSGRFPEPEAREAAPPAPRKQQEGRVRVNEIRFSGSDLAPEADLRELVRDAVGREMGFSALQGLADKVTRYLRSRGYVLARAYLPPQDATEGIIEIVIMEGRLEGSAEENTGWRVSLAEGVRLDPARLAAIAEAASPSGGVPQQTDLERALLLMNDLPGIKARARIEPGAGPGTSRIVVDATQGPLFEGNLQANNYGSHSVGGEVINAHLDLNDPWGMGDHVGLDAIASQGVRFARLGYDIPLGAEGLRANADYTNMRYEVVNGIGRTLGNEGSSHIIRLGATYPFIRARAANLSVDFGLGHKNMKDESDAGVLRSRRVEQLTLGLRGNLPDGLGGGGFNTGQITFTAGDLDLSRAPADDAADAASLRTQGDYRVFGVNLSRLQRLPANFSLLGRVSGQLGSGNLDSSEEFILGGPAGVRAYPVGEAQGDEGWLANLDLRYDIPGGTPLGDIQLSTFVDAGHIRLHDNPGNTPIGTATGRNHYSLQGWGIGAALVERQSHSVRLSWASRIGDNPGRGINGNDVDDKADRSRWWLQGAYRF